MPSEVVSAFLWAQLEELDNIQNKRKALWREYYSQLETLSNRGCFEIPQIPEYATNNGHLFYIICKNLEERTCLIEHLKQNGVLSVFHYLSLHQSDYYKSHYTDIPVLPNCERYADCLLRLPMYYELSFEQVHLITGLIKNFYCK